MEKNQSGFKNFLLSNTGRIVMLAVLYLVIWGIVALFAGLGSSFIAIILFALLSYFGWKALDRITPNMFLIMSVGKWVAYYIVKGILSFFIGFFVAPYQIAKIITNKIQESVDNGN
ncbi:MAG: hypothetical protein IJV48_00715 [Ruminococcus sp.]|nr:hypothetical protein [Ruminococcus sp.]